VEGVFGRLAGVGPVGLNRNLLVNRDVPPFDNPDLRHAMALSLDRQAFIDILTEGQGDIGGVTALSPATAGQNFPVGRQHVRYTAIARRPAPQGKSTALSARGTFATRD